MSRHGSPPHRASSALIGTSGFVIGFEGIELPVDLVLELSFEIGLDNLSLRLV